MGASAILAAVRLPPGIGLHLFICAAVQLVSNARAVRRLHLLRDGPAGDGVPSVGFVEPHQTDTHGASSVLVRPRRVAGSDASLFKSRHAGASFPRHFTLSRLSRVL